MVVVVIGFEASGARCWELVDDEESMSARSWWSLDGVLVLWLLLFSLLSKLLLI
jgi:hypothetical protein